LVKQNDIYDEQYLDDNSTFLSLGSVRVLCNGHQYKRHVQRQQKTIQIRGGTFNYSVLRTAMDLQGRQRK
jgi:hypothetical protein